MTKALTRYKNILQAAILCSCLLFVGCENEEAEINAWTERRVLLEEAKNVETYFSQGGRLRAKLHAPIMIRSESDTVYVEFPKNLHVDFYDSLTRKESFLDARYGKYFENQGKVWLRDSVKVISLKGDTLSTVELWWNQNTQRFYTDSTVQIATKSRNIYGGKGMEASQDLSDVIIKYPSGTVLVSDSLNAQ